MHRDQVEEVEARTCLQEHHVVLMVLVVLAELVALVVLAELVVLVVLVVFLQLQQDA